MKRQHGDSAGGCHQTVVATGSGHWTLHWRRGKSQRILSDDDAVPILSGSSGSCSSRSSRGNDNELFHTGSSMQFAQDVRNVLIESVNGLFADDDDEDDDDVDGDENGNGNGNTVQAGASADAVIGDGSYAPTTLDDHNSGNQGPNQQDAQSGQGPQRPVADGNGNTSNAGSSSSSSGATANVHLSIWEINSASVIADAATSGAAANEGQEDESSDDDVEIVGVIGANRTGAGIAATVGAGANGNRRGGGTNGSRHLERPAELFSNVSRPAVDDLTLFQTVQAFRATAPDLYSDEAPRHLNIHDVRTSTSGATSGRVSGGGNNNNNEEEDNRNNVVVVEDDDDDDDNYSNRNNSSNSGSFYDQDDVEIIGFRHSDTRPPLFAAVPANIGCIDPRFVEAYLNVLRQHSQYPHDSIETTRSPTRDTGLTREQRRQRQRQRQQQAGERQQHEPVRASFFPSCQEHIRNRHIDTHHCSSSRNTVNPVEYHSKRRGNSIYNQVDTELGPGKRVNSIEDVDFLFTCPICYSTIARFKSNKNPGENDRVVYSTKCGHIFCFDCIEGVKRRRECPICRKPVREKSHYHVLYP